MKPSEILARAAEINTERGHCKGSYRDEEGRVCAMGAIYSALGALRGDGGQSIPVFGWGQGPCGEKAIFYASRMADRIADRVTVSEYNDLPGTSAEDITLLLKKAAADAEAHGE